LPVYFTGWLLTGSQPVCRPAASDPDPPACQPGSADLDRLASADHAALPICNPLAYNCSFGYTAPD
jgi:hypothetical protein